jgi:hypothetical protein
MKKIRLATEEEITSIQDRADLDTGCTVVALDTPNGPILGVMRQIVELDPVVFPPKVDDRTKYMFIRDAEILMMARGVPFYYFNIKTEDESWIKIAERAGAQKTSEGPEFRFKKII